MSTTDLIFFGVFFWVLFVAARLSVFAFRMDIKLKKKLWPAIIFSLVGVMLGAAYLLGFPTKGYAILLLAAALIVYTNLKGFYFCESCGNMLANKKLVTTPENCAKCGASLKPR